MCDYIAACLFHDTYIAQATATIDHRVTVQSLRTKRGFLLANKTKKPTVRETVLLFNSSTRTKETHSKTYTY